ncbi:MAG: tetratricopeptide repeat protein [Balneolaceae bacterium]|jgi:tetratricopeptide (TPR) repeat protein
MKNIVLHTIGLALISGLMLLGTHTIACAQDKDTLSPDELIKAQSAYIDGLAEFENENYEKALGFLKKAYVKLPNQPGINYALADTYLQINDLTNAEYFGRQAVELDPKNKWYHLKLVDIYQASGKNSAIIRQLNTALSYDPRDTDLLYELARAYTLEDSLLKANDMYDKILHLEGSNINIHLQKLHNFSELHMQDSAIVELEAIRELDPDNLSTLRLLSNYYLDMDRLDEAKAVLENALQINSKDAKTLTMLSDIYIKEEKWDSLGVILGGIVTDSTVSSHNKIEIAQYLYSKYNDDPDNAELRGTVGNLLQKLMKAESQNPNIQALAADFFSGTNQNALALDALKRTNELMPTNDSAWRQRLQLLLIVGRIEEAISVGREAAQKVPQDPIILYFLGSAYLSHNDYSMALKQFEEASTLPARPPLKASIYAGLGSAHASLKNWDQAFDSYEQSLQFTPDNPGVLNNYAYYLSLQKKNLKKAETMALRAVKLDPKNASYLDTLGWVYYQMGKFKEAQEYIQQSLDTGKASAEVMEHMGDIMDKLNNTEKAKYWWRKALQKDSTRTYLKEKVSK